MPDSMSYTWDVHVNSSFYFIFLNPPSRLLLVVSPLYLDNLGLNHLLLSTPDFLHVFTGLNEFKSTSSVGRTRKNAIFLCEIITGVNHFSPPLIIPRRSRRNVLCALVASTRNMYSGDLDSHCESYVMATR